MTRACSTHRSIKKWSENMTERDHSEDLGADGKVGTKTIT